MVPPVILVLDGGEAAALHTALRSHLGTLRRELGECGAEGHQGYRRLLWHLESKALGALAQLGDAEAAAGPLAGEPVS